MRGRAAGGGLVDGQLHAAAGIVEQRGGGLHREEVLSFVSTAVPMPIPARLVRLVMSELAPLAAAPRLPRATGRG